nr:glycosyltransferase family 4 protein [uncultured Neokomagataea sp.]
MIKGSSIRARRPVILQVLPALGTGGLERGAVEIAAAIQKAGGEAVVAAHPGALLVQLHHAGADYVELDLRKKSLWTVLRGARAIERIIREYGVDVVHARSRIPAWAAWLACRRTGTPMITTWHGTHNATWWGKRFYNSVLVRGTRVIAISRYIARRMVEEYGVSSEKLRIIPRGADPVRFDPATVSGERIQNLASAWDLPHGARVILMPARLTRWKGQGVLVEALARLRRLLPSGWVCVFIGPETDTNFASWLGKRVTALELRNWVRFAGTCSDMAAAYALADVVVAPSLRPEPFGRTVVEAQLMGKPVVGTAQGAMMETILPDETGVVVPPYDEEALAVVLERLLTTEADTLAYLAENARAHVLRDYTTRKMQAATLGVYDEVLGTALRQKFEGECLGR